MVPHDHEGEKQDIHIRGDMVPIFNQIRIRV
jgi:hypothetical protein